MALCYFKWFNPLDRFSWYFKVSEGLALRLVELKQSIQCLLHGVLRNKR